MSGRLDAARLPVAVRSALGLAMILGLLTMCHAAFSIAADSGSTVSAVASTSPTLDGTSMAATTSDDSAGEGLAGDCALLMTCTAALVALGAMLMLRGSRSDRVLWQRLVPVRRVDGVPSRRLTVSAFVREPAALVC